MKVLIYSDLQADDGSMRLRSDPSTPLQRWRVRRFYQWFAAQARGHKVDAVWDLGDTTNDRTALTHPVVQSVTTGCELLMRGLPRTLSFKLLGNHEQSTKATAVHCGDLFSPYFHVIQDRQVVDYGKFSFVLGSYPADPEELSRWLKQETSLCRDRGQTVVVLGHFSLVGARMNSGLAQAGVSREALSAADLVLLGHIHKWQEFQTTAGLGFYLGSPFPQDFGEASDPSKVCALLTLNEGTGEVLDLEWLHPPGFPAYRTITVDDMDYMGDDVCEVVIRTQAEAQRFYAHPLAATVKPVYAFSTEQVTAEMDSVASESREQSLGVYVEQNALPGATTEEVLRAGLTLCQ